MREVTSRWKRSLQSAFVLLSTLQNFLPQYLFNKQLKLGSGFSLSNKHWQVLSMDHDVLQVGLEREAM